MSGKEPISDDFWEQDEDDKLLKLRDVYTVGAYLVDKTVSGFFKNQVTRMGDALGQLEGQIMEKMTPKPAKKVGLEKQWIGYMDTVWDKATAQLNEFMDKKVKELKGKLDCTFDSTARPGTPPANANENKCKALEFIHKSWEKDVKGKIDAKPWGSKGDSEGDSEGDSTKGSKGNSTKGSKGDPKEDPKGTKRPVPPQNESTETVPTKKQPPVSR
jgi:hypothetical protein